MDKMTFKTKDITKENVEKIAKLFPNVMSEGKVDFEKLRQELSNEVIDKEDECYDFTWVGKKAAMVEANKPTTKTLRPCIKESVNFDTTGNLYIEGDNLEVLKLLQESYLGKIKMIYIDPPYNTGNDFIYNDDFKMNSDEYKDVTGEIDEDGNRMFKNSESNGRYHSDWCSMIYMRLKIARDLLKDEGLLFISIDDNELFNLKKICDEVFGEVNLINNISIKMSELSGVKMKHIKNKYPKLKESLLIYAKNINNINMYIEKKQKSKETLGNYLNYYSNIITNPEDECENWIILSLKEYLKKNKLNISEDEIDEWKISHSDVMVYRTNSRTVDSYMKENPNAPTICRFKNDDGNDVVKWENKEMLFLSKYLEEYLGDIWMDISTINLNKETESVEFSNGQKPLMLLKRIINSIAMNNETIIDFFSGSATTAHAVMLDNISKNNGINFIMVQIPEDLDLALEKANGDEKKNIKKTIDFLDAIKKPHNICEIGKERIRRAGKKILEENKKNIKNLDIGFRVLKLDDSNMKDVFFNPEEYTQDLLSKMTSNIKEDRTEDDLLFASLIERGVPLNKSYRKEKIDKYNVIIYNEEGEVPEFIACFDENISEKACEEIAKMKPLKAVFRDSSFGKSSDKINIEEIFKMYSPDTKIKVM